jgi:hypothetical protein
MGPPWAPGIQVIIAHYYPHPIGDCLQQTPSLLSSSPSRWHHMEGAHTRPARNERDIIFRHRSTYNPESERKITLAHSSTPALVANKIDVLLE